jgi:hypothetical protein
MKCSFIASSAGLPSASATNIGPSAEPPMPMDSTWVNRAACVGLTAPRCTDAVNVLTCSTVLRISAAISADGARLGARSQ